MKVKIIFDGPGMGVPGCGSTTYLEIIYVCDCKNQMVTYGRERHCGHMMDDPRCRCGAIPAHPRHDYEHVRQGQILEADLEDGSLRSDCLKRMLDDRATYPSPYCRILKAETRGTIAV